MWFAAWVASSRGFDGRSAARLESKCWSRVERSATWDIGTRPPRCTVMQCATFAERPWRAPVSRYRLATARLYGWPEHRDNVHRGDGYPAAEKAGKIRPRWYDIR